MRNFFTLIFTLSFLFVLASCGEEEKCLHTNRELLQVVSPTCENGGYTYYRCHDCSTQLTTDWTDATGHENSVSKNGYAATCTEYGLTDEIQCLKCKTILSPQQIVPALEHTFNNWTIEKEPSETEEGLIKRICSRDNTHIETKKLPILNAGDYEIKTVDATCAEAGAKTYIYKIDNQEFKYSFVIPQKDHSYQETVVLPTCTTKGYTTYSCSCGDTYIENYADAIGHQYDIWKVEVVPTDSAKGSLYHECLHDETHVEKISIPTLNEIDYQYNFQSPTCKQTGLKTYTYHHENKEFVFEVIVPVVDHNPIRYYDNGDNHKVICEWGCEYTEEHKYAELTITKNPTCSEEGLKETTCSICSKVYNEAIQKTPHTAQTIIQIEPTCTSLGYTEGSQCSVCGEYIVVPMEIEMLPHNYIDGKCDVCDDLFVINVTYYNQKEIYEIKGAEFGDNFVVINLEGDADNIFIGWYNEDYTIKYTTEFILEESLSVYAKWETTTPIATPEELLKIADNPSGNYYLTQNIDLRGYNWTPLTEFNGNFDGNHYRIENFNLTINTSALTNNYSIFGINNGTIKNLELINMTYNIEATGVNEISLGLICGTNNGLIENITIHRSLVTVDFNTNHASNPTKHFGFISGTNNGNIANCIVDNNFSGYFTVVSGPRDRYYKYYHIGGITGTNANNAQITSSNYNGTYHISISTSGYRDDYYYWHYTEAFLYLGGVVGVNTNAAHIYQSYSTTGISVISNQGSNSWQHGNIGGFVGINEEHANILECYANSTITSGVASQSNYGGFVGYNSGNARIESCHSETNISLGGTTSSSRVGGFAGYNTADIQNSYAMGAIEGKCSLIMGGFVADSSAGQINKCFTGTNIISHSGTSHEFIASGSGTIAKCFYLDSVQYNAGSSTNGTINPNADINAINLYGLIDSSFLKDTLYWDMEGWHVGTDEVPFLKWEFEDLHNFELIIDETEHENCQSTPCNQTAHATCTEYGYSIYQCSDCFKVVFIIDTDTIPTGHNPIEESKNSVLPTCTEDGYTTYLCNNSGCINNSQVYKTDFVDALGHDIPEYIECTDSHLTYENGYYYYTCNREDCNHKQRISLSKIVHGNTENIEAKLPTCDVYDSETNELITAGEKGHTAGVKCLDCEQIISGKTEILPHYDFDESKTTVITKATCLAVGEAKKYCNLCEQYILVEIPQLTSHLFENNSMKCSLCNTEKYSITDLTYNYQPITSVNQFMNQLSTNGYYYLANDLDLSELEAINTSYKPLFSKYAFKGHLLGNGYKIKNLKIFIEDEKSSVIGLFAQNDGIIAGLTIENVSIVISNKISADAIVGIIAGINTGVIYNCNITGNIDINLLGHATSTKVQSSTATYNYTFGGIAGENGTTTDISGSIQYCKITGNLNYVDEIISTFAPTASALNLNNILKNGNMTVNATITSGGICGTNRGEITNTEFAPLSYNYYTSAMNHFKATVGGIGKGKAYTNINLYDGSFVGINHGTIKDSSTEQLKKNNYHGRYDDYYQQNNDNTFGAILKYEEVIVKDYSVFQEEYSYIIGLVGNTSIISNFNQ